MRNSLAGVACRAQHSNRTSQQVVVQQRLLLLTPVNSSSYCSTSTLWCSRSSTKKTAAAAVAPQISRECLLLLHTASCFFAPTVFDRAACCTHDVHAGLSL
jgi:hypothetical protein